MKVSKKHIYWGLSVILLLILTCATIYRLEDIEKSNREYELEKKKEARFDKLAGYLYPYLKDISDLADTYRRMLRAESHCPNKEHLYSTDILYYSDGGSFTCGECFEISKFFKHGVLSTSGHRAFCTVTTCPPKSRYDEAYAIQRIYWAAYGLGDDWGDMFDTDVQTFNDKIDSLTLAVHYNLYLLNKYRKSSKRVELDKIPDYDYQLENY